MALDDNVLKQVAETGLDRALVAAVDLEVIRDGALLADVTVRLDQDRPRGIAELGPAGGQLLERGQTRVERGELLLAHADLAGA